jgi:hypothetical protein
MDVNSDLFHGDLNKEFYIEKNPSLRRMTILSVS